MAAVGALLTQNREKRKYRQRTVLTGMRRCEVIERFRLSPERIEWLILKFEGQLRRNTGRNAPLDPEIQVGNFPFFYDLATGTLNSLVDKEALFEYSGGFKCLLTY